MSEASTSRKEDEVTTLRRQVAEWKEVAVKAMLRQNLEIEWEDLPLELQKDRDFVLAALRGNKLSWYSLSDKWKADVGVAVATMESQAMWPTHWLGDLRGGRRVKWQDLPVKCQTSLDVVVPALRAVEGPRWNDVPVWFRSDPNVVLAALERNKLRWRDVPTELQQNNRAIAFHAVKRRWTSADDCPCLDREFLRGAVEGAKIFWDLLPTDLRDDVGFARSCSRFANEDIPRKILQRFPVLRQDVSFWQKVMDSTFSQQSLLEPDVVDVPEALLRAYAPQGIRSDRDIMTRACGLNAKTFPLVHPTFGSDREFLDAVLEQSPQALRYMHQDTQLLCPDLVQSALTSLGRLHEIGSGVLHTVIEAIAPSLWDHRDFVLSWARSGFGFPEHLLEEISMPWREDKELFLLFAKHPRKGFLRNDEDFICR